ncbi:MAG: polysaccharide deacetylase family protein [Chryseolinea sp.]
MNYISSTITKAILSSFPLLDLQKGLKYIFVFHDVSPADAHQHYPVYSTEVTVFQNQINWLKKHFRIVSLAELVKDDSNKDNCASIVFDDGFKSVRDYAFPILQKTSTPFTVFVNKHAVVNNWLWCSNLFMAHKNADAGYLKKIYDHFAFTDLSYEDFNRAPGEALITRKKLKSNYDIFFDEKYSSQPTYLTETDIKFLIDNQCVIGSHTTNHKLLSNCTDQDLEEEIVINNEFLKQITSKTIDHFAIPFGFDGTFDTRTVSLAKKFHTHLYSTERTHLSKHHNHSSVYPRIGIRNENLSNLAYAINLPLVVDLRNTLLKIWS